MPSRFDLLDLSDLRKRASQLGMDEAQLAALLTARQDLDVQLRKITETKRLCAKDFGPAKARGDDVQPLKVRMQEISTALLRVEQQRSANRADIQALFDDADADAARRIATVACLPATPTHSNTHSPTNTLRIDRLAATEFSEWQAYVAAHPDASLYHDVRWRHTIQRVFGHEQIYLLARDPHNICGVLPLTRLRSRLFGDFLVSMPFLNYGGALADSLAIADALMHEAARLGATLGVSHIEFRDVVPRVGWPAREDKVAMLRSLPATSEALFAELGSKLRAQIRRPEREGATVQLGGSELLDAFYAVFAHNMRDLGTPVYEKRWFAAICEDFADAVTLSVAHLNGRAVGAGFMIRHRQTMEIPWASTLRAANPSGINMLLYWRHLEHAIHSGCTTFDFGRSTRDAGTYRFKQQWGAQPRPLHWHYWLAPGRAMPRLNPDNPKFKLAIAAWQRLPVWLTRVLGPPIVRHLP